VIIVGFAIFSCIVLAAYTASSAAFLGKITRLCAPFDAPRD
jgi:hypothetical protein